MNIKVSTATAFFRWKPAAWLRVSGPDAPTFLQGQFSNDLRPLFHPGADGAVYGLWLSVKGKVVADSFVLRGAGADEFWVGSYDSPAAVVRERLESYLIADEVMVEDATKEWSGVSLLGPEAAATWAGDMAAGAAAGARVFRGRRERGGNLEVVTREVGAELGVVTSRAGPWLDAASVDRRRIESGIPAVPRDLGPVDLPNEGGLEGEAISYTKGCYLGQEVMARLKSMGQIRRRLVRVRGTGVVVPSGPAPLFLGGRQVGELRSTVGDEAAGWIGLAMVSRVQVTTAASLALAVDGAPTVQLQEVP